jgi:threonine/homoserine/homoserine lactone efflux protein
MSQEPLSEDCTKFGIDLVSMVAPTSNERIAMIAKEAEGFLYCVSSLGVTGMRSQINADIEKVVAQAKKFTDVPCAIGFGISNPAQASNMAKISDGVIVGSAIVKIIAEHGRDCIGHVKDFVKAMKTAIEKGVQNMATETFSYVWMATLLGIQAGFSPGPVTTMIITQSLLHGRRAGAKMALVPVLTDIPVVCIVIPTFYYLTIGLDGVIAVISIVGACLLCWLGYESLSVTASRFQKSDVPTLSLPRAVGINFFNPNLYIYWLTICGPLCASALRINFATLFLFIGVFYICMTSVKLGMALVFGNARKSLNWLVIVWINRLLGVAMFCIAATFFWKGYTILFTWASATT